MSIRRIFSRGEKQKYMSDSFKIQLKIKTLKRKLLDRDLKAF